MDLSGWKVKSCIFPPLGLTVDTYTCQTPCQQTEDWMIE